MDNKPTIEELINSARLLENNLIGQETDSPSKTDVLFKGEDEYW